MRSLLLRSLTLLSFGSVLSSAGCSDDAAEDGAGGQGASGQGGESATTTSQTSSTGTGVCEGCSGDHVWSRSFGGPGDQVGNVGVDGQGNPLIACRFVEGFVVDSFAVMPTNLFDGELDACVGKLSSAGETSWFKAFGAQRTGGSFCAPVADAAGNVYAATTFEGLIEIDGQPLSGVAGLDIGVVKMTPDGTVQWMSQSGAEGDQHILALWPVAGGVLATGAFEGSMESFITQGGYDVWVGTFDARSGTLGALRQFGSAGGEGAYGVAQTADGGAVFIGGFEGTIGFGGGPLTSAGSYDGFVAKIDAAGNHVWSKVFGDTQGYIQLALTVDRSNDEIVIVLGTVQVVDLGGGPTPAGGGWDVVVTRLDAAGNHKWTKRFGDAADQQGIAVAAADGYTVVTGDFGGNLDFGGGPLANTGGRDVFAAKLGSSGEHVWSKRFGDAGDQKATSVAIGPDGSVLLGGYFDGTIDFGGGPLTSQGGVDFFVAKLLP